MTNITQEQWEKCPTCKGSGYKSASENMPPDTPSILMPIGTWPCPQCQGRGKVPKLDYLFKTPGWKYEFSGGD